MIYKERVEGILQMWREVCEWILRKCKSKQKTLFSLKVLFHHDSCWNTKVHSHMIND